MSTFRCIHPLSGVSTRFQLYQPCLHMAHRKTNANGANFVINCHKTRANTLKSQYSIQTCFHSAIFGRAGCLEVMGLENFPQKKLSSQKKYLHFKKCLGQSWVGPLFTAGQKYVGVE